LIPCSRKEQKTILSNPEEATLRAGLQAYLSKEGSSIFPRDAFSIELLQWKE